MKYRRLNPSAEQERRAAAVMRDPNLDLHTAIDLANRILAGEEIAGALAGTGLVVDAASPRPMQIAEVQTARGVVEVPVKEAAQVVDPKQQARERLRERLLRLAAGQDVSPPPPQPRDMLGVIVNPKTFAPCFACTVGPVDDRFTSGFIQIYDDVDTAAQGRSFRSSWAGRGSLTADAPFGFPIVHTGGENGQGVRDKNRGYGTALYVALCLGTTLAARQEIVIPRLSLLVARGILGEGISSDPRHRTEDAAAWWRKAIAHGMASRPGHGYDIFPFAGGADRFCAVVGVTDWFSLSRNGRPVELQIAPEVFSTLNLSDCDPRVVDYLGALASRYGIGRAFNKAVVVADVLARASEAGVRMNPDVEASLTKKERHALEERRATIHALGMDVPFSD